MKKIFHDRGIYFANHIKRFLPDDYYQIIGSAHVLCRFYQPQLAYQLTATAEVTHDTCTHNSHHHSSTRRNNGYTSDFPTHSPCPGTASAG